MTDYASLRDAHTALGELDLTFPAPLSINLERSKADYERWVVVIHTSQSTFDKWVGASRLDQVETTAHDVRYTRRSVALAQGITVMCLVERDVQTVYSDRLSELEPDGVPA